MAKIGLLSATAVGIGAIIGAGIFVLSGVVINLSGTGALLAFTLTGIVAAMIALQMGELSSVMPNARGATYSFAYEAFGSELAFITGALLYLAYAASISAISLGFGTYLGSLLGMQGSIYQYAFSLLLIAALSLINYLGVRRATRTDAVLVGFKIFVLAAFIGFAMMLAKPVVSDFSISGMFNNGWSGIFAASVIAMFAYAGFQSIASLTPDVEGGGRTVAKAILLAVVISGLLYVGVIVALLSIVPASAFGKVADPLSFALTRVDAPQYLLVLVGIGALVATASASLSMMIGGSRLLYQISEDHLLPKFLRKMHNDTPSSSTFITALIAMALIFAGNIYIIAAISNFGILLTYMISGLAVIKVRRIRRYGFKHPAMIFGKNMFQTPLYPYLTVASIICIIVFFLGFPAVALSGGVISILLAIIIYYSLREIKGKPVIKVRLFK